VFNATFLSAKISLQVFTKEAFSSFDASDNFSSSKKKGKKYYKILSQVTDKLYYIVLYRDE
jgi:hypothetical protein